jgi:hypothetical protein
LICVSRKIKDFQGLSRVFKGFQEGLHIADGGADGNDDEVLMSMAWEQRGGSGVQQQTKPKWGDNTLNLFEEGSVLKTEESGATTAMTAMNMGVNNQ